jgi:hypothetical protein
MAYYGLWPRPRWHAHLWKWEWEGIGYRQSRAGSYWLRWYCCAWWTAVGPGRMQPARGPPALSGTSATGLARGRSEEKGETECEGSRVVVVVVVVAMVWRLTCAVCAAACFWRMARTPCRLLLIKWLN